ncbi:MAG: phosphate/phosphite/phosphonate ABC transporter substrate-binding protein [Chloroflexi bacterium]|nr:phosphate/phosphite/phosphonate ABC transporter substrate-binding protein [Chloroflexota bacterium]
MLIKFLKFTALVGILTIIVGCSTATEQTPAQTTTTSATGTITLADISGNPTQTIEEFQPLADYLAANLGGFGISVGRVKVAPDLETMSQLLASGEVDLYFDSPYPAMYVSDISGAQLALRRWKGGVAEYNSTIFSLSESGFTSLSDLEGQMVGFEEPFSTSGYFLPTAYLLNTDLNLVEKSGAEAVVAEDEVGYVFTEDNENTIRWVINGKIDAGAVSSSDFTEIPDDFRSTLTILSDIEAVPRHVMLIGPNMDPALKEAIMALLINMNGTTEGQKILEIFEETAQFDTFPTEDSLTRMQELYGLVQGRYV